MKNFLFFLLCVLVSSGAASAETLIFSKLEKNETIVIGYRSTGCFHDIKREYRVTGGDRLGFSIIELESYRRAESGDVSKHRPTGGAQLTNYESLGLDVYLYYLRGHPRGSCTTVDEIAFGYYRDGQKIGEERFSDASCDLATLHLEANRVVGGDNRVPPHMSLSAFRAIVPPWLIEARIRKEPNLQPTLSEGRRG